MGAEELSATSTGGTETSYHTGSMLRSMPLFRMEIHHKTCTVLLDTGSTVNIVGHDVLTGGLGIPDKFVQKDISQLGRLRGITGQQVNKVGNIHLQTEFLGCKTLESFVVLPKGTFGADALVGYPTMKRWGLIIDCEEEKAIRNDKEKETCLSLEEEKSPPDLINLAGNNPGKGKHLLPKTIPWEGSRPTEGRPKRSTPNESHEELVLSTQ